MDQWLNPQTVVIVLGLVFQAGFVYSRLSRQEKLLEKLPCLKPRCPDHNYN